MPAARFTLTERQIRQLIEATPEGHVAQITIAFPKDESADKRAPRVNPADLVDP